MMRDRLGGLPLVRVVTVVVAAMEGLAEVSKSSAGGKELAPYTLGATLLRSAAYASSDLSPYRIGSEALDSRNPPRFLLTGLLLPLCKKLCGRLEPSAGES